MKSDPVALALRHVRETKSLLESLILSSESFDYQRAKTTLKKLERKTRELDRLQQHLEAAQAAQRSQNAAPTRKMGVMSHPVAKGKICVVDFKTGRHAASSGH